MLTQLPGWAGAAGNTESKGSCTELEQQKPPEFSIQLKPELRERVEDALGSPWVKYCGEVTPGEGRRES